MKVEMLMPQMGESITEARISKWKKGVGDSVTKDEIILEISTDKVDSEIPVPAAGVISQILYKEGDVVPVKTLIAVIETEAQVAKAVERPATAQELPTAPTKTAQIEIVTPEERGDRFYSPLVKSLAEKHGLSTQELELISGSGQAGRVNKEDLLSYLESKRPAEATPKAPAVSVSVTVESQHKSIPAVQQRPAAAAMPDFDWNQEGYKIVPMDNMRQAIAEHMVRSKRTSPHVYSVQEVDMTSVSRWRSKHKADFQKSEGFGLSFTPFFLEASIQALQQFPYINSSIEGQKIILKKHINLGCAVALGTTGLIVPVIKHAEEKNLVGLARSLNDLAQRARSKKLQPDDVMGGTFTVTNPGVFGTIIGTPIINQPQVAILCLGAITKRAVVIDDMIAIREMCYLTLSYDHRVVDGSMAGQFLALLRKYLEGWDENRPLR